MPNPYLLNGLKVKYVLDLFSATLALGMKTNPGCHFTKAFRR